MSDKKAGTLSVKRSSPTVVREICDTKHRIAVLNPDGTNESGDWVPLHAIATFRNYFAIVGESALPQGVFTCKEVPSQVLA